MHLWLCLKVISVDLFLTNLGPQRPYNLCPYGVQLLTDLLANLDIIQILLDIKESKKTELQGPWCFQWYFKEKLERSGNTREFLQAATENEVHETLRVNTQLQKPEGLTDTQNKGHLQQKQAYIQYKDLQAPTSETGGFGLLTFGVHIITPFLPNTRDGDTRFSASPVWFWSYFLIVYIFLL